MGITFDKCCGPNSTISPRHLESQPRHYDPSAGPRTNTLRLPPGYFINTPNPDSFIPEDQTPNPRPSTNTIIQYRNLQDKTFVGRIAFESVDKLYKIGKEIGSGKYGIVRMVAKKSYDKKRFALKTIHRDLINTDIDMLERELDILMNIDHPNIIDFQEIYMDDDYFNFVTQLCQGSDLFYNLEKEGGRISEKTSAKIVKQILLAIKHLHDQGICHRDLKLENIMLESNKGIKEPLIKVIDFGFAKYFKSDELTTKTGTPYYMAPEILEGKYGQGCDMWAIGVIAYCLLVGYPPFDAENEMKLFKKIRTCDFEFIKEDWEGITDDAKSFILKLLQPDPAKRLKPEEALQHPWILKQAPHQIQMNDYKILDTLKSCKKLNSFQRHILSIMISLLEPAQLAPIRNTFLNFDNDFSGTISLPEFINAFRIASLEISDEEVLEIFNRIKPDDREEINWSSFLYASLDKTLYNQRHLKRVFKFLDCNLKGYLTCENVRNVITRRGHHFAGDDVALDQIIIDAGIDCCLHDSHNEPVEEQQQEETYGDDEGQEEALKQVDETQQNIIKPQHQKIITFAKFCEIMGLKKEGSGNSSSNASVSTKEEFPIQQRKPSFRSKRSFSPLKESE